MPLSNVHIVYDLIHLHYQSAGTYVDKLSAIHGYHLAAVCVCVCVCCVFAYAFTCKITLEMHVHIHVRCTDINQLTN